MTDLELKLKNAVKEKIEKLIPENIKKDINIFGITGSLNFDTFEEYKLALITAKEILGSDLADSVPKDTINELQMVLNNIKEDIEANLKPENIKTGITILGITGTYEGNDISTE